MNRLRFLGVDAENPTTWLFGNPAEESPICHAWESGISDRCNDVTITHLRSEAKVGKQATNLCVEPS